MLNREELNNYIKQQNTTKAQVARALGISAATLYRRIRRGVFGADEIKALVDILHISNPMDIFFAKE
jgi:DNA-binding NtrC family response regulator